MQCGTVRAIGEGSLFFCTVDFKAKALLLRVQIHKTPRDVNLTFNLNQVKQALRASAQLKRLITCSFREDERGGEEGEAERLRALVSGNDTRRHWLHPSSVHVPA